MSDARAASTTDRTILVADIVSSTSLYEQLGNVAARTRVGGCLDMLTQTATAFGGTVVKSLGDGLLCAFGNAQRAVLAGLSMCDKSPAFALELRVGLHRGEVLEEKGDVYGDAVNTASRIADLAKPREILISRALKETLPAYLQAIVRGVPPVSLKGKRDQIELFAVLQEDIHEGGDAAQTIIGSQTVMIPTASIGTARLRLSHAGEVVSVDADGELTIGREPERGLTIDSQQVSRLHARIFHRQGKFVLVDQSTNGTFLKPDGQPKVHLLREQAILHGSGAIYAGIDPDLKACEPIHYRVF